MDVTFAENSNEVTPCKIEFNYRNNFDNYTRWKLRKVIKVALFRNKRFALNEMFQQNTSKFAIFYV